MAVFTKAIKEAIEDAIVYGNGILTIEGADCVNITSGYPHGVQDFRNLTAEGCVDQLEQAIQANPELAKALKLMNSKLYKALK